jgi:hypothetical protein
MADLFGLEPPAKKKKTGMAAHHLPTFETEVWLTPPPILEALGPFDLDPCACSEPRPWPTASVHYTRRDNGLHKPWHGRVFLNPPYGAPPIVMPWLARMADHHHGTALIFARTETDAFHEHIWASASAILFLRGRLFFHRPDGTRADHNAGAPSCLVAYGSADVHTLSRCGLAGHLVRLR